MLNELNDEQLKLLKEADIIIKDRDYTEDECRYVVGQIIGHIMSFSKKDIKNVANKYEGVIDKITNY